MDIYELSPLGQAEQLYNQAEREKRITEKLKTEVKGVCQYRQLTRRRIASDLRIALSTFNQIVQGTYTARTDDHVIRILRYSGCTEQEIVDTLRHDNISFRDLAANDEQIVSDEIDELTDDDVKKVFDNFDPELPSWKAAFASAELRGVPNEHQAEITEMQSDLQRQENHTVYAPVHLGSWLQLQWDLIEEIPQAHLNAFVYRCITRMSEMERYKIKRIIDDLRQADIDL